VRDLVMHQDARYDIINYALRLIIRAKGACENWQSCLFFSES